MLRLRKMSLLLLAVLLIATVGPQGATAATKKPVKLGAKCARAGLRAQTRGRVPAVCRRSATTRKLRWVRYFAPKKRATVPKLATTTTAAKTTATTAGGGSGTTTTTEKRELTIKDIAHCTSTNSEVPEKGTELVMTWGASQEVATKEFVIPAFERDTGLKVKWVSNSSDVAASKIAAAGGGAEYDVAFLSPANLDTLRNQRLLEYMHYDRMPEMEAIPVKNRDITRDGHEAITVVQFPNGLGYNHELLSKKGLPVPKHLLDMFDPVYKDVKIGVYQPPFGTAMSGLAAVNMLLGGEGGDPKKAIDKWATIKDRIVTMVNNTQLNQNVAKGEMAMWWDAAPTTQSALVAGLPVKMVFAPHAYMSGVFGAIPKNPKRPGAACIFMNWLSGNNGQKEMMKVNDTYTSPRPGAAANSGQIIDAANKAEKFVLPGLMAALPSNDYVTQEWNRAMK